MGGGSADASFTLTAINELCSLGLSTEELEAIALTLGADCPIFVRNQPAVGRGIGEVLTPLALDLKGYHLTIVKPPHPYLYGRGLPWPSSAQARSDSH